MKDKVLNQAYRDRYRTCKGTYALTVPFMERFFGLAKRGHETPSGWVGQITSNSFMKREFGSKLIESFLAKQDLRQVIDTSGAYIPGHGTPTLVLVARSAPATGKHVRAVLGVRGEPGRPENAAKGLVWSSIREHLDTPGWQDQWISVVDLEHDALTEHPWSLSGGAAPHLLEQINISSERTLDSAISGRIGFASFPGADDCFFSSRQALQRHRVEQSVIRPVITGDVVRDWAVGAREYAIAPYDSDASLLPIDPSEGWARRLWPNRVVLGAVTGFGGETQRDTGRPWWAWYRWVAKRYEVPLSIAFAFVATHNHFVLDRGGKVFKQSAPVIKLPEGATEDDHLALLGVLNSSTACFWLKQNSHNKGNGGIGGGIGDEDWEPRYEFTGTTLQYFPLPSRLSLDAGRDLDRYGRDLANNSAVAVSAATTPSPSAMSFARDASEKIRAKMISRQEELDWEVYQSYGLTDESVTYTGTNLPGVSPGERSFEIALARRVAGGETETAWFERHGSTPITEVPSHWPADYRALVERRLELIAADPAIRLLESPEHKRRWATEPWQKQEERALRGWLLDRLEAPSLWQDGAGRPSTQSIAQLTDRLASDTDVLSVLELWSGRRAGDVQVELGRLLADEHVPFLAALRYKASGLRKREQWEQTWELQRAEDRGERVGDVPVPPKYTTADFARTSYWRHRGKLDVPKERFISYPGAERGADQTLVLGWAGWDHAEQAQALASLSIARAQREGWEADRLTPLLAGLAELEPWVHQWHTEVDPRMGVSPAQAMTSTLDRELARLGLTRDDLLAWRPQAAVRGRRPRTNQEA